MRVGCPVSYQVMVTMSSFPLFLLTSGRDGNILGAFPNKSLEDDEVYQRPRLIYR